MRVIITTIIMLLSVSAHAGMTYYSNGSWSNDYGNGYTYNSDGSWSQQG